MINQERRNLVEKNLELTKKYRDEKLGFLSRHDYKQLNSQEPTGFFLSDFPDFQGDEVFYKLHNCCLHACTAHKALQFYSNYIELCDKFYQTAKLSAELSCKMIDRTMTEKEYDEILNGEYKLMSEEEQEFLNCINPFDIG